MNQPPGLFELTWWDGLATIPSAAACHVGYKPLDMIIGEMRQAGDRGGFDPVDLGFQLRNLLHNPGRQRIGQLTWCNGSRRRGRAHQHQHDRQPAESPDGFTILCLFQQVTSTLRRMEKILRWHLNRLAAPTCACRRLCNPAGSSYCHNTEAAAGIAGKKNTYTLV